MRPYTDSPMCTRLCHAREPLSPLSSVFRRGSLSVGRGSVLRSLVLALCSRLSFVMYTRGKSLLSFVFSVREKEGRVKRGGG